LWALGDTETAVAAMGAHRTAVQAGLTYLDTHAGLSRRGTVGTEQIRTEGLVVALFDYRTSLCADPQLHTHAALQQARTQAGQAARAQQRDRDAAEIARARAREQAWEELPEHRTARAQLEQLQAQRDRLRQEQVQRRWSLPLDEAELERTSRWAPRRRRDLTTGSSGSRTPSTPRTVSFTGWTARSAS
jgi:multidrug efflux pump subunit AcrA (membrane-fusion protein)